MDIINLHNDCLAKIKGGQIFLPFDPNCQTLIADGDQTY